MSEESREAFEQYRNDNFYTGHEWALGAIRHQMFEIGYQAARSRSRDAVGDLVNKQAEDEGLWFMAETITEAYLQNALRELHAAAETNNKTERE